MNILVIGCGLLGRKIARTMDSVGWDVSALSSSSEELEQLEPDFGGVLFRGFPMDLRSLREAGIESCHAVAVTTEDDNLNIAVAQIARDYFGIENVVACISEPEREAAPPPAAPSKPVMTEAGVVAPPTGDLSFEEKLKKFMQASDSKNADKRRNTERKQHARRK